MKAAFLTQNRPEFLARIPQGMEHVVAWADQPDGTYSPAMLEKLKDVEAFLVSAEPVHAQLLEACPKVKIVQRIGVGYDTLDLEAGKARGVPMCNVAGVNKEAVAEFHIALILALNARVRDVVRQTRDHDWSGARGTKQQAHEISGKTIGIIGLGATGSSLARIARGFDMKVLYNDIRPIAPSLVEELEATSVEKEELFAQSDFVDVCTTKNETSINMVNRERLALMKKSAYLICCARGGIVNEPALREALDAEQIAGAGIDVFEEEPVPQDNV